MPQEAVLLSCPPSSAGGLPRSIRERGNIPVMLGESCLFELTPEDIRENWQAARKLQHGRVGAMACELGLRLYATLYAPTGDEAGEPEAHAGEAAACLFLALRHHDVPLRHALSGCQVTWNARARTEHVECLA